MSEWKRTTKHWNRSIVETMGMILGVSAAFIIMIGMSTTYEPGDSILVSTMRTLPYYIFMIGSFLLFITVAGIFQTYVPLLISFNSRRTMTMMGVFYFILALILALTLCAALIWGLLPDTKGNNDLIFLPMLAGGLLFGGGFALLIGAIITKWGKIGMVIFVCCMVLVGGIFGGSLAAGGNIDWLIKGYVQFDFSIWFVLVTGILTFLIGAVVSVLVVKKMEVCI